jgi:hypothetical protein
MAIVKFGARPQRKDWEQILEPTQLVLTDAELVHVAREGRPRGRPSRVAFPGPRQPIENSCVCGLRRSSRIAPAVSLPLKLKTLRPSPMLVS